MDLTLFSVSSSLQRSHPYQQCAPRQGYFGNRRGFAACPRRCSLETPHVAVARPPAVDTGFQVPHACTLACIGRKTRLAAWTAYEISWTPSTAQECF